MPKKPQITLSPLRSGRRIRWTFEVSADVGAENRARAKKPAKKAKKRTRTTTVPVAAAAPAAAPAAESSSAVVIAPVVPPRPFQQFTRTQIKVLAGAAVFVIALIAVPRQPTSDGARSPRQPEPQEGADVASNSPIMAASTPPASATSARPVVKARAIAETPKLASVQNVALRRPTPPKPTSPAPVAANAVVAEAMTTKAPVSEPVPAVVAPSPSATIPPVTITGCLEMSTDGTEFRLADTEGSDAPKLRSWRTGFLRKRTAPVALAGPYDPLELKKSVGKRVSATGPLSDRELQVTSLRVVGSSCN